MSSLNRSMSTSYKAVFALSILMIFVVIIGGAMSGSKSVGFGIWYWGYTAWKMYKRDNDSLVSLQKIMLWFEAIAFSVALAVLLFSDADVRRYVDVTPLGLIILASISMGITYLLYRFFDNQKKISSGTIFTPSSVENVSDKHWEQASRELDGVRHEATWAKAVSSADGDDSKARALYLKIRATSLQNSENEALVALAKESLTTDSKPTVFSDSRLKRLAFIGVLCVIVGAISFIAYDSNKKSATEVIDGVTQKKYPLYRQLSDGTSLRWNRDTECFIKMTLDFSNSVNPVVLSRTSNSASTRYKELTQEERVIAVVFYDSIGSNELITKHINRETFLRIKGMCEVKF